MREFPEMRIFSVCMNDGGCTSCCDCQKCKAFAEEYSWTDLHVDFINAVADGIREGRAPFLEVHNPTDSPIVTAVYSPPHAPVFGGTRIENVAVPSGTSITLPLKQKGSKGG